MLRFFPDFCLALCPLVIRERVQRVESINLSPMSGWVWHISKNIPLPKGLKLVKDKRHHYCVAPTKNMPVDKYKGLLEEMALRAKRIYKKEGKAV